VVLLVSVGCSDVSPPTAPDAAPVDPATSAPMGVGVSGNWVRTGYAVAGRATLVIEGNTAQLDFSSNFSIAQTPGAIVYLNTTSNPNMGQPLRIGALRSFQGAQSYRFQVPLGVRYTRIIIWCDPFNVGMAEVVIPPTGAP
jgi:hypothetical protein